MIPPNVYENREQLAGLAVEAIDNVDELRNLAQLALTACYAGQLGNGQDGGHDSFESDFDKHGKHLEPDDWDTYPEAEWACPDCGGDEVFQGAWCWLNDPDRRDPDIESNIHCVRLSCDSEIRPLEIVRLPEWGCVAWVSYATGPDLKVAARLHVAEARDFSERGEAAGVDCCAPTSQRFLNHCNRAFTCNFKMEDFAGR
jgi:hypothetical protein